MQKNLGINGTKNMKKLHRMLKVLFQISGERIDKNNEYQKPSDSLLPSFMAVIE